jgi:hypothetical protein
VSDSFIISVPLEEQRQHSYTAARGVFAALHGIAGIALIALAEGSPLRGGIDVGLAINLRSDESYGPVLRSAYRLESRADYPRVLIGLSLIEYLESFIDRNPKGKFEEAAILICRAVPPDSVPRPSSPSGKEGVTRESCPRKVENVGSFWRRFRVERWVA